MKFLKLVVVVSLLSGMLACSKGDTTDTHINKAKIYIAENKVDESVIELKNAIKKSPKNAEARFLLGRLYLSQGGGFEATKELEKAYELGYIKSKVIPLLARAYLLVNSDDDIIALFEQALELPDEVKSQYLAYNTLANIRLQENATAKNSEQLANQLKNNTSYSYLASAYMLLSENKLELAKAKIIKSLNLFSENLDSIMLLGQTNAALGLHSEATKNYLKFAELQPKSNVVVLLLADSSLKEKDYITSEKYADIILSKLPNQPIALYIKAIISMENQDYEKASDYANKAESFGLNSPQLKLVAGVSAYYLSNFEQSYHHLTPIISYLSAEHPAKKMYVISQLQLGLISDINQTLGDFNVENQSDAKFLSTLSLQLAEIGALSDAKQIAEKVINNQPASAADNLQTGVLKLLLNDPSGITNLEHAISLEADSVPAELLLVSAAAQVGDYEKALKIAEELQRKQPNNFAVFNVIANVYLKKGDLALAKTNLEKSLSLRAKNQFAYIQLVNIAFKEDNNVESHRLLNTGLGYFPDNVLMLKQLYVVSRENEQERLLVSRRIKTLFNTQKNNLKLALLYAEILLDQKKYKESLNVLNTFQESIHSPKSLWQLKVFALSKVSESDIGVITFLEKWIRTNPYVVEPVLLLVDKYLRDNKRAEALRVLEKSLGTGNKNNSALKIARMQLLLDGGELEKAKSFYPDFSSHNMNEKLVKGVQGRIYFLEKNYNQALPLLNVFFKSFPSRQNALSLAITQKNTNHQNDAIQTLLTYLDENPLDSRVQSILAEFYLEKQPEKAMSVYEKMLVNDENNVVILNNLAWLNLDNDNVDLALKYSAMAIKLAPKNPNVVDTRGMALLKAGDKVIAMKVLKIAYELTQGKNVDIAINFSQSLIANEKFSEAIDILKQLKMIDLNEVQKQKIKLLFASAQYI